MLSLQITKRLRHFVMNQKNNEKIPDGVLVIGSRLSAIQILFVSHCCGSRWSLCSESFQQWSEVQLSHTDLERLIRVAGEEKDPSGSPRFVEVVTGETAKGSPFVSRFC